MRTLIALFFTMLAASATADEQRVVVEFYCLSGGENSSIHLEYRTFIDIPTKWITAYVKYKNSSKPIQLVLKSEESEEIAKGRPWQYTLTWLEIVGGKITGEYEVMSQGIIRSFTYKNYRNGRVTGFGLGGDTDDGEQCKWE
jgi:hypothetical protein